MEPGSRNSLGGGCLIFLGFLAGAFVGLNQGEPSRGAIIGTAAGIALAVLLWVIGRRPER